MDSKALNPGNSTLQDGKYIITGVLGQGGFGITYQAEQVSLGRKVAIKEFFMKEYCERDGSTSHVSVPSSGSRELVERFRQKFLDEGVPPELVNSNLDDWQEVERNKASRTKQ